MKKQGLIILALIVAQPPVSTAQPVTDSSLVMWYETPASHFTESLPLGNGRLGMMVFGGIEKDRIVLNEESVWSGSRQKNDRPNAHERLPEIRRLLLEGRNDQAERLVNQTFTCKGEGSGHGRGASVPFGCYQVLGNLSLEFDTDPSVITEYRRQLDLRTALADVSYKANGIGYHRQYFTSAPDQVGVIHLTASRGGALTFGIGLDRPERFVTEAVADNELIMTGQLNDGRGGGGGGYAVRVRVLTSGGNLASADNLLTVHDADMATILFAAETDYDGVVGRDRKIDDPVAKTAQVISAAAAKSYEAMLADHIADHRRFFDRVSISFDDGEPANRQNALMPTDKRIKAFVEKPQDPDLPALYFNFGRYLLIGSSRPGTLPANLQGIWAQEIQTPWNGDWHLDINIQMNYWPAEICGLGDCHVPMLKLIEALQRPGQTTARAYYNADGWVAHVITNAWGFTAPGERASWGSTVSGSGWLCEHLWEHYAFTADKEYLRWDYPIMKGSAQFYLDMLITEPDHGWLVTAPSNSPENAFRMKNGTVAHTCMGPTVDMQILRELFGNCITAAEVLGVDQEFRQDLKAKLARLAPNQVGPDGRLQEWLEPYDEPDPHHRHISHMYGLYPYYELTPRTAPKLAAAAARSLERRGFKGDVGWANAWKVALYSRLLDGDQAYAYLKRLIGRNAFPNLFNACWPGRTFQIDGNFGGTAGIAEMLLQSYPAPIRLRRQEEPGTGSEPNRCWGEIHLLPALPDEWPTGQVKGLRARGGFVVDIGWKDQALSQVKITSKAGGNCKIRYRNKTIERETEKGGIYVLNGDLE
jgi:alpha-L-fucosidase 2